MEEAKSNPVLNIVAYLQYSGFYAATRDVFAKSHENDAPVLVSIRGPGGVDSVRFATQAHGAMRGPACAYSVAMQRVWTLPQDVALVTIGRARGQHVLLPNQNISKFHASIRRPFGRDVFCLHDERSTFGTALVKYADNVGLTEDLATEDRMVISQGESADLEDRVVIECAGLETGTRLAFFSDYGHLHDYLSAVMNR